MLMRWGLLAVAVAMVCAASGVLQSHQQPSAQRLVVTAITGLIAPLFWPGAAATAFHTQLRVAGWSLASAALAALLLLAAGRGRQSLGAVLVSCAVLALVLAIGHAVAAGVERLMNPATGARELGGTVATLLLVLSGGMPLWLGPAAEIFARGHGWALDALMAASPLTHLALASGNDLLRNEWLYDHSNLAKLAVGYPSLAGVIAGYAIAVLALLGVPLAQRNAGSRSSGARPTSSTTQEVR